MSASDEPVPIKAAQLNRDLKAKAEMLRHAAVSVWIVTNDDSPLSGPWFDEQSPAPHHRRHGNAHRAARRGDRPTRRRPRRQGGRAMTQMTKTERTELDRLIRRRFKVAKAGIDQRAAEVLADFEEQLAREYDPMDLAVKDLYDEIKGAVKSLNDQVKQQLGERGIPEEFAPGAMVGWVPRGGNASASRRAELRKVAERRVAAQAKAAKVELERREVEICTHLVVDALETEAARSFLEGVPTLETLVPAVPLPELEVGK